MMIRSKTKLLASSQFKTQIYFKLCGVLNYTFRLIFLYIQMFYLVRNATL